MRVFFETAVENTYDVNLSHRKLARAFTCRSLLVREDRNKTVKRINLLRPIEFDRTHLDSEVKERYSVSEVGRPSTYNLECRPVSRMSRHAVVQRW